MKDNIILDKLFEFAIRVDKTFDNNNKINKGKFKIKHLKLPHRFAFPKMKETNADPVCEVSGHNNG